MRTLLVLLGATALGTPIVAYLLSGQGSHGDDAAFWHWWSGLSLNQWFTMQGMVFAGMLLLNAAMMLPRV
jgi:hypothetical protein